MNFELSLKNSNDPEDGNNNQMNKIILSINTTKDKIMEINQKQKISLKTLQLI